MTKEEHQLCKAAIEKAIDQVLQKGCDDVFRPPTFSQSIEHVILQANEAAFRKDAFDETLTFLRTANLSVQKIGPVRRSLVAKDENTYRQVAWLDPFDTVKYLTLAILVFPHIEAARIAKSEHIVHSHRMSEKELFDRAYGYDSFRSKSADLSQKYAGKWKVITDIANFFDRIGNHTLENHLLDVGADKKYVTLIREVLLFWAEDRRSYGIPVGSDASRILSEAVLLNADRILIKAGITFIRYVDDYRIFAESKAEALKSIEILTTVLADEGLSLNSRKTDVIRVKLEDDKSDATNRFAAEQHEPLDLTAKKIVRRRIQISGRTSVSRFYHAPGKEALRKIRKIGKMKILDLIDDCPDADFESNLKLATKFFIYVEQDVAILEKAIERRVTSIFYIADALEKESDKFEGFDCDGIRFALFEVFSWQKCAYPLQLPLIRIAANPRFRSDDFVRELFDAHKQSDPPLFFREAISLGSVCLDRARIRHLAMATFSNVPDFVTRSIYFAVLNHPQLSKDEKRPLLKTMKQKTSDWFIDKLPREPAVVDQQPSATVG